MLSGNNIAHILLGGKKGNCYDNNGYVYKYGYGYSTSTQYGTREEFKQTCSAVPSFLSFIRSIHYSHSILFKPEPIIPRVLVR